MKNCILLLFLLFNILFLFGQDQAVTISSTSQLDAAAEYDFTYLIKQKWSSISYTNSEKVVTAAELEKLSVGFKKRMNHKSCYLNQISFKERLVSEGMNYHVWQHANAPAEEVLHEGKDSNGS